MRHDGFALEDETTSAPPAAEGAAAHETPSTGVRLLTFATLGALVFLVYELTASEMAAAIAGGLKFAWDDVADGVWLFRRDPRKLRGALLLLVQASRGAYSAAMVACGVAAAADLVLWLLAGNQGNPPNFMHLAFFSLSAAGVCVLLTLMWLPLVLATGVPVWAGGGVSKFRRRNEWPPRPRGRNSAPALIGATAYFVVAGLAAVAFMALPWRGPAWPGVPGVSTIAIGIGVAAAFVAGWWGRRMAARWAEDCWPDEPHPHELEVVPAG